MTSGVFAKAGDPLTIREQEALIAYAYKGTTQGAADVLGVKKRTLKAYLTSVYRKFGVTNSLQAWSRLRIG